MGRCAGLAMPAVFVLVIACGPGSGGDESSGTDTGSTGTGLTTDDGMDVTGVDTTGAVDTTGGGLCEPAACPRGNPCQEIVCSDPPILHDAPVGGMLGLYNENCSLMGCHDSVIRAGGLSLAAEDDPWCSLVDRPSMSTSPLNLVEPGEPLQSYFWHKLVGSQACPGVDGEGDRMPPFPTCGLSESSLDFVTEWICCGAPKSAEDPLGEGCFSGGATTGDTGGGTAEGSGT